MMFKNLTLLIVLLSLQSNQIIGKPLDDGDSDDDSVSIDKTVHADSTQILDSK